MQPVLHQAHPGLLVGKLVMIPRPERSRLTRAEAQLPPLARPRVGRAILLAHTQILTPSMRLLLTCVADRRTVPFPLPQTWVTARAAQGTPTAQLQGGILTLDSKDPCHLRSLLATLKPGKISGCLRPSKGLAHRPGATSRTSVSLCNSARTPCISFVTD